MLSGETSGRGLIKPLPAWTLIHQAALLGCHGIAVELQRGEGLRFGGPPRRVAGLDPVFGAVVGLGVGGDQTAAKASTAGDFRLGSEKVAGGA